MLMVIRWSYAERALHQTLNNLDFRFRLPDFLIS